MTEEKKNKSGAGKFFLGAALGTLAGAIAGKFISNKEENEGCACKGECECDKKATCDKGEEKVAEKTKTTDKADKKTTKKEA